MAYVSTALAKEASPSGHERGNRGNMAYVSTALAKEATPPGYERGIDEAPPGPATATGR